MNYELAKELKDAGFPQMFKTGTYYAEQDLTYKEAQVAHSFFNERRPRTSESELAISKCISIPTLSELIEECGEKNPFGLRRDSSGIWEAMQKSANGDTLHVSRHSTPQEAVARLWLDLRKDVSKNDSAK